ncbi:MAG: NADH:flavin oxidoreductase [Bacteroidales bacterium]|jgi:2,4-dienoyl-CoA reductase-like NADH-dependent reductase (Old Yellow Enzyme family)|nr:NADH:flavin oxidoreductase [Bacteroidales bacterium]
MSESKLFTPYKLGPVTLRNRTVRAAAFEGMCANNGPTDLLYNYHTSVAQGGIGMTTIAYAAVTRSGLSFPHQLWMRKDIVPGLKKITDSIHAAGAAASIQLGHCGNMSKRSQAGQMPISASYGFNLYSPTFVRRMNKDEIKDVAKAFGTAVNLAREAGFDCVEIHAGHGYLLSQFLSKFTNHRHDEYGGSLENRMRFMTMAMEYALEAAKDDMAVVAKMNMNDGFKFLGGMQTDECIEVAKRLESLGTNALVLSGGFVSHAPMHVMCGEMPIRTMAYYEKNSLMRLLIRYFGRIMVPTVPFKEAYFYDDAMKFRQALKMPLIYVGGLVSREKIDMVLDSGFELVAMARALINEPDFVNRMKNNNELKCGCEHANYCIGRMYSIDMACHKNILNEVPKCLLKEIEKTKQH